MENSLVHHDSAFRRIVVASTGLGLAFMLGSLASIRIQQGRALEFDWHWSVLIAAAAAVLWNSRFWKAVWSAQENPSPEARRKLGAHLLVLVLLGLGSFLYPIRFIEHSYWSGISRGLVTAVAFLGTMLWLIYKAGRIFTEIDNAELKRERDAQNETAPGESTAASA